MPNFRIIQSRRFFRTRQEQRPCCLFVKSVPFVCEALHSHSGSHPFWTFRSSGASPVHASGHHSYIHTANRSKGAPFHCTGLYPHASARSDSVLCFARPMCSTLSEERPSAAYTIRGDVGSVKSLTYRLRPLHNLINRVSFPKNVFIYRCISTPQRYWNTPIQRHKCTLACRDIPHSTSVF